MESRKINIKLIEKASEEKWLRMLAFFYILKLKYANSCIYNYRSRMPGIAKELNISTKTLYNRIKVLRDKDLVFDHHNNLMLKSFRKENGRKAPVLLDEKLSLAEVEALFVAQVLKKNAQHQAYCASARAFLSDDRPHGITAENPFESSFSQRTMALISSISLTKANKIVKILDSLGVVKIKKQKPRLIARNFTELSVIEDFPGHRFLIGNCLFQSVSFSYEFVQDPVFSRPYNLARYRRERGKDWFQKLKCDEYCRN